MVSSIIWVIVFIGILIIFHEFGHLIAAKLSHIPVEVFSVGFGPVILKKKFGETEYRLSAVPLGGFIKMVGEEEKAGPAPKQPVASPAGGYMDKPLYVKVAVIAAGPVSNLVLGFLILVVVFAAFGQPYTAPVISPNERSTAYADGLRPGDVVVAMDGETIPSYDVLDAKLQENTGRQVRIAVRRDSERLEVTTTVPPAYVDSLVPPVVANVVPGGPASATIIQPGDTIAAVAGIPVTTWVRFTEIVRKQTSGPYELSWRRAGTVYTDTLQDSLTTDAETGQKVNMAGIQVNVDWYIAPQIAAVLGNVRKGGPADKLGLRTDDSIVEFAGVPVREWSDFTDGVYSKEGRDVPIIWQRAGKTMQGTVSVSRGGDQLMGQSGGGAIGVSARMPHRKLNFLRAVGEAASKVTTVTVQTYVVLYKAVTVRNFAKKALGGPIMVAKIAYEGASWGWDSFLLLFAVLSVNLFVVNMLPVPVLDGGRILLDVIASVRRRPLSDRELTWAGNIGWLMIGVLVVFTLFNDILRLIRK